MSEAAAQFEYSASENGAVGTEIEGARVMRRPTVSIFADRHYLRAEIAADVAAIGLKVRGSGDLLQSAAAMDNAASLGELVFVDCPAIDPAETAALSLLDVRVARGGGQLIAATSMESLDTVFGCVDQSRGQILVAPNRAERIIAIGQALARIAPERVNELGEEDRVTLLRLTEQVAQIAATLERLGGSVESDTSDATGGVESPRPLFFGREQSAERLVRAARPPLPDPRLVRRIIRQRQLRSRFFDGDLFADPAWDILLDLTAARAEHMRVSVTSLCIASGVPPTTALRWIGQMTDAGLLQRVEDEIDRRRAFITLTDRAAEAISRYFAEIGSAGASLV